MKKNKQHNQKKNNQERKKERKKPGKNTVKESKTNTNRKEERRKLKKQINTTKNKWKETKGKKYKEEHTKRNFIKMLLMYHSRENTCLTFASGRAKAVSSCCTFITAPAWYVGPAAALSPTDITLRAERTLRIALTSCGINVLVLITTWTSENKPQYSHHRPYILCWHSRSAPSLMRADMLVMSLAHTSLICGRDTLLAVSWQR